MAELFSFWTNGFGFGVFLVMGIVLLVVSRTDNAVKRACVLMAINLFYLALRMVVFAYLPEDSAFYVGHEYHVIPMFSMSTAIVVNLVLIQLTHYAHVTWGYALKHLMSFVQLIVIYYVVAIAGNESLLTYIFRLYVLCIFLYMLMYTVMIFKAVRRYDKELTNTYVNTDGRSLNWFRSIIAAAIILFVANMVANIVFQNTLSAEICRCATTFLWAFFACRIAILRESFLSYESDEVGNEEESIESEAVDAKADEVNAFMERLRQTLETDGLLFDEDLTRDDVMRAMSVTHVTLGRNLHAATGMSFSAYVTDLRLERIADLLLKSDENIERIYYSCGFRSRTTFYRAFARKYECSPVEYRRARKK